MKLALLLAAGVSSAPLEKSGIAMGEQPGRIDKGLRKDAISFASSSAIALSSTSPAYSMAATLGPVVGIAAFNTPGIMILAFIPMLFIAVACYHLNRAEPDCGTSFLWVTRAIGPGAGWVNGWSIIVANILVMPSLADISGHYSLRLIGIDDPSAIAVAAVGVAWIVVLTAICYLGISWSARTQMVLLIAEIGILVAFALAALGEVYLGSGLPGENRVALDWFNPFLGGDLGKLTGALVLAVFIYWGWDSCISVNEETTNPDTTPGHAAMFSTVVLMALYVLVAVAAVSVAQPQLLVQNSSDVLGPLGALVLGAPLDRLLALAVLSSAVASTQTSILPAARLALSMAHAGAIAETFGRVHPRHLTPGFATATIGVVSILWYIGMTIVSSDVLADSIAALGLVIAFYYGMTGFACVALHRRVMWASLGRFVSTGLIPAAGGVIMFLMLIQSCISPGTSQTRIAGLPGPVAIGMGSVVLGAVLMLAARWLRPEFFSRRRDVL